MSELDIIRAWKDKTYRNSLSAEELAHLPEHPAGAIELTNDELAYIDGGTTPSAVSAYSAAYSAVSVAASVGSPSLVLSIVTSAVASAVLSGIVSYYVGSN